MPRKQGKKNDVRKGDSDAEDTQPNDGLTEYERERLENIRRNQEAMRMFDLPGAAASLSSVASKKAAPATAPATRRPKRTVDPDVPRRTSNRRAGLEPDGAEAKRKVEDYEQKLERLETAKRVRRSGDLSLADASNGIGDEEDFKKLLSEMATYVPDKARVMDAEDEASDVEGEDDKGKVKKEDEGADDSKIKKEDEDDEPKVKKEEAEAHTTRTSRTRSAAASRPKGKVGGEPSLRRQVQSLRIRGPWPTLKICRGRVYSMAIHPNPEKVLVCGGDIDGNLGFWDLDESKDEDYEPEPDDTPSTFQFQPERKPISSMQYSPVDSNKLFMTSYAGSIRYLDLAKQQFVESYVVSRDATDHIQSISIESDGHNLWYSDNDGFVNMKDLRTPKHELVHRTMLHEKKIGCVHVNPKYSHLIVTSSLDRTMRLWDVRKFDQDPIPELSSYPHNLSVTSAHWSPDGNSIVSTSYDDRIRVFNNFDPALPNATSVPDPIEIRHNNQSGRWVTMLRAVWAPQFNWFSIGNMNKSVDIYSRGTGDLMANLRDATHLTTVPAVNAWHPSRVVIASGMANGKMVIWR
ncbi:hypothetical protein DFQ27_006595 [Actinomortierella ambigua]|uniref:DNA damage-binding protein CMR1 n=1 Tax=Actinomortierella ambigua TaxID=1343610 RepID=A0A9P6PXY3_9FUNG|nr:hypothetical protein DFQ27_006595 [Actinomortierella ambigua]